MRASSLIAPSSWRRRDALREDLFGLDQRIVVGVVLEEEFDHARDQDRAARDRPGRRLTNEPAATPRMTTSSGIICARRTSISLLSSSSPPLM